MTFRAINEPELIEVKDWSVWLRFTEKTSQSDVYNLLWEVLDIMKSAGGKWEIRPIWPVEEREER